jgi:NAD(P)-dependent dehydrogenase (short-subunit alcohol dehydrogenase family)
VARRHEGRTAVISGAAAGIGQAAAVRLAAEGARIVIADRNQAQETLQMIAGSGGRAVAMQCDVSDPGSVEALKAEVEKSGGGCDILVNNAGIYPMQAFDKMTFADGGTFFRSMFLMAKAFVEGIRRREWGRVINLASDTVSLMVRRSFITSPAKLASSDSPALWLRSSVRTA